MSAFPLSSKGVALDFTDDYIGRFLADAKAAGEDLSRAHEFGFQFYFGQYADAQEMKLRVAAMGLEAEIFDKTDMAMWILVVTVNMVPTHAAISAIDAELNGIVYEHDGNPWRFGMR